MATERLSEPTRTRLLLKSLASFNSVRGAIKPVVAA
jgi:hypothetical protein